jgi:hypothetical protein
MKKVTTTLLMLTGLSGCGISIDPDKYLSNEPRFKPFEFFHGNVNAWGIVQNRSGNIVQQFTVTIEGNINSSGALVLDEEFTYQIGQGIKRRVWELTRLNDNRLEGKANDILNPATGQIYGHAMRWQYSMDLPVEETSYRVNFDDWMWAFDTQTLINRSYIKKFGITMAEVTIFMQKAN